MKPEIFKSGTERKQTSLAKDLENTKKTMEVESVTSMDSSCNTTTVSPGGGGDFIFMEQPEDMLKPWNINPHFLPIMITHGLTFLVGVIGNIIIISTMTRDKTSRNATSMFLVSLAVADLLLLVVCIPLETLHYFVVTWDEEGAICKLSSYAEMVSAVASVLNLTAVSLERYIVIVYPMKTRSFCTMSNCRRALILVWVVALILSIPVTITRGTAPITYYNNHTNITTTIFYCWDGDESSGPFAIAIYQCCIMFIVPCLLMIFCYSRVIRELWTSTKAVSAMTRISSTSFDSRVSISAAMRNSMYHSPFNSNSLLRNTVPHHKATSTDDVRQARKQVIKMLILVIVLFLVCWGPRVIMQIFIKHGLASYSPAIYSIRVACMQLPFVHSCLNPIIYSLMSSNFRRMMVRSCTRHHPCSHIHFCCHTNSRRIPARRDLPSSTSANYELTFNSELIRVGPMSAPSTCSTMYETNRTSPDTDCDNMIHCDIIKLKC